MTFVYFIVMVGVLVLVHELGHFVWAKAFGVRVLKLSLGFGPRVAGFSRGGTEYVISAIPLGGYVRMLGENPRDRVRPEEVKASFAGQSLFRRIVIVVGGPLMNLVFPIVLYFLVFLGDSKLSPATIGVVFPGRPSAGKLQPGDQVVSVDGEPIETFYELTRHVEQSAGEPLKLSVLRNGETREEVLTPVGADKELPLERTERVGRVGIMPHHPVAVIGVTSDTSPAAAARMRAFDVVVAAAGTPIRRYIDLERVLSGNRGSMVPITYLRPMPVAGALGGLVELDVYEPRLAVLTPEIGEGTGAQRAGIELADLYVSHVTSGSPEHRAGLLPGDRLLTLDGRPIELFQTFLEDLRAGRGKAHELTFRRNGETLHARFQLQHMSGVTEHGQKYDRYVVGIRNWVPARTDPPVDNPSPIFYAAREAFEATADMAEITIFSIVRLLQGRLSVKSIGGPLTIFEVAGTAAREGALNYLTLMAFISINLGLINLLPIPLLDGGHLLFVLYEAVVRRPVSTRMREYAHIAGLVVLVAIMILAFKNDLERQWPRILDQIASD
jgi:regulator of sigma E protease